MKYSSENLRLLLPEIGLVEQKDISEELPRNGYTNNQERVLRVLSWLSSAEKHQKERDYDVCLMCALAAFNGLYAVPPYPYKAPSQETSTKGETDIKCIINQLIEYDKDLILWEYLSQNKEWEKIIYNQYLYRDYWKGDNWEKNYEKDNRKLRKLAYKHVKEPLAEIMHRIKVLRNQLMHGEAGYKDYYNRWQVDVCANFLPPLVGRMLRIMIDNKDKFCDEVPYPPQTDKPKTDVGEDVEKFTSLESENG